jgi:hypothetical protein
MPFSIEKITEQERYRKLYEREREWRRRAEAKEGKIRDELSMQQRLNEFAISVARAACDVVTADQFYHALLQELGDLIKVSAGHVYMLSKECPNLFVSSEIWRVDGSDRLSPFVRATARQNYKIGEGLPGITAQLQQLVCINKPQASSDPRLVIGAECGILSAIGFPVVVQSKVISVIEFFTTREEFFE